MNRVGSVLAWAAVAAVVSGGMVAGAQESAGREGGNGRGRGEVSSFEAECPDWDSR